MMLALCGAFEPPTVRFKTECSTVLQLIEKLEVGSPGRIRTYSLSVNSRMIWFHTLEALRNLWWIGKDSNAQLRFWPPEHPGIRSSTGLLRRSLATRTNNAGAEPVSLALQAVSV